MVYPLCVWPWELLTPLRNICWESYNQVYSTGRWSVSLEPYPNRLAMKAFQHRCRGAGVKKLNPIFKLLTPYFKPLTPKQINFTAKYRVYLSRPEPRDCGRMVILNRRAVERCRPTYYVYPRIIMVIFSANVMGSPFYGDLANHTRNNHRN